MSNTDKTTWRDPELGRPRDLDLPGGRLRVFEAGRGEPIVFVHGVLVNANLWRKVVARLSPDFRCIAIELPLGSHQLPLPAEAPNTPETQADAIADALEALDLEDVTLVGNDTGGAICQLVVTRRPDRVGRLVLTSCDYRENFPPPPFKFFRILPPLGGLLPFLFAPLRLRPARRLPIALGWVTKRQVDRQAEDTYVLPVLNDKAIRRDVLKVLRGTTNQLTIDAANKLTNFDKPALIAWSADDKLFPRSDAEGLARDLPNSRLEWVEDSYTFSPEDNPERVAELIAGFVREPVAGAA